MKCDNCGDKMKMEEESVSKAGMQNGVMMRCPTCGATAEKYA